MKELKPRIHENGMDYVLVGDYYVPDLKLPEERRPIGHWGRLHQSYLKLHRPMACTASWSVISRTIKGISSSPASSLP